MNDLNKMLAFAKANKLHAATEEEMDAFAGYEGRLFVAESDEELLLIDVKVGTVSLELVDCVEDEGQRLTIPANIYEWSCFWSNRKRFMVTN